MERKRQKGFIVVVLLALMLGFSVDVLAECKVTILHFNDFHGNLEAPEKKLGGAERLAALIGKIQAENELVGRYTLVLMGGDLISGTPVSERYKGEAEFKFLKAAGASAMVVGNHDFDFGREALLKNAKGAGFDVLAANIIDAKIDQTILPATVVFPLESKCRVGVLGLTSETTPQMAMPGGIQGLKFRNTTEQAAAYIDDLVEQSEITLALTHQGVAADVALAKKVKGFNAIIGGHDHVRPEEYCRESAGIPVCQTPAKGTYLGRIDLSFQNGKVEVEKTELLPVNKKSGKFKEIKEMLLPYLMGASASMNKVVGSIPETLAYYAAPGQKNGSPLAAYVVEAMRKATAADVAFINQSTFRKDLKKGEVTAGDVFEAMPFSNEVEVVKLTGTELQTIIDKNTERAKTGRSSWAWAGLENAGCGSGCQLTVQGKALEPSKSYTAATVDFVVLSGDVSGVLKKKGLNPRENCYANSWPHI